MLHLFDVFSVYKTIMPMPEIAASVTTMAIGRRPFSAPGTVFMLPAPELDAADDPLEPDPDDAEPAPAPVPVGWLVTVPVPAVPASARREEQVAPAVDGALVAAAPLKAQAEAELDCAT